MNKKYRISGALEEEARLFSYLRGEESWTALEELSSPLVELPQLGRWFIVPSILTPLHAQVLRFRVICFHG